MIMRKSIIVDLLILLGAVAVIWGIFTIFPIIPNDTDFDVSIDKEEKLGKLIVDEIILDNQGINIVKDSTLDAALNLILLRLYDGIGSTDYDYKIIVIDSPMINAAALPGGYIILYTGLIEITDSPEELAAIIAHEIGHVEKKHIISRLIKELGLSILFSGDAAVLGEVFKYTTSTAFSRQQESEADIYSLQLMEKAKIHPIVLATIFRKFNKVQTNYSENLEILSTHPHNNSRIKAALGFEVKKNFKSKKIDLPWDEVKAKLK
jgi:predicted Zn-dependent protease